MKRILVFCDGTWNRADQERAGQPCPTNIVETAFRIAKRDGSIDQVVNYDQGVGTGNQLDHLTGGAFGEGLEANIHEAYRFLVANYEHDDDIYLLGFSRGAYTVRSLGGMIRKCGVLKRDAVDQYGRAVELYRSEEHPDDPGPKHFRKQFAVNGLDGQRIKMIGVWDTVGALGIPLRGLRWLKRRKFRFHDPELSGIVEYGFHALAIDEHRAPFAPTLWAAKAKESQHIEQVWFCGAHSDVGGGYSQRGLSDIALKWMLGKIQEADLVLDKEADASFPLSPNPRSQVHNSKKGLYRATRGINRKIGVAARYPDEPEDSPEQDDPTQSLHPSVLTRWDEDPAYRPPSLIEYFARVNDPRSRDT